MDQTIETTVSKGVPRRSLAAVALLVLAAGAAGISWKVRTVTPHNDSLIVVGKALPQLVVRDGLQKPVDLRTVKSGTRRVVAFYSPSCEVCQQELPELIPFPKDIELIMVNEAQASVPDPFAASTGSAIRFSDPDSSFHAAFTMPALPTLLFVNEQNIVVDGLVGAHPAAVAQAKLHAFARGRN